MNKQNTGKTGEIYAAGFLNSQNYLILNENYRTRFGEIDLIAIDRSIKPNSIVFVEVKTRKSERFGIPEASITWTKKQKLIKTALKFLNTSTKNLPIYWRIDGIGIQLDGKGNLIRINHIKNI